MTKKKNTSKNKKRPVDPPQNIGEPTAGSATGIASAPEYSQIWPFLESLSASRTLFVVCAIMLPFIALASYTTGSALYFDFDMWFHLAYGREYVQNLTWTLDHSQFSWTPAQAEWMYAWLGSALMYVTHQATGVQGLFVLHHLTLAASAGAVIWLSRASGMRAGIWLLTALLTAAIMVSISGVKVKPEMFSTLLVTLTAVLCFRFRMAPSFWIAAILPIVFLFWVNTHGLWFFGLAFLGLFLAASLFEQLFLPRQALGTKALLILAAATGLAILALTVNPDGIAYPARIFFRLAIPDSEATAMRTAIVSYQTLWGHLFFSDRILWTGIAWLAIAIFLVFLWTWKVAWKRSGNVDLPVAATNIAFFLIGMTIARLILVYSMIWLATMVFLAWRLGPKPLHPKNGPLVLAAFLLLAGVSAARVAFLSEDRNWLGFGYQDYIPDKEVAFIMDNHLPGPIFNCYLTGGYMMWAMYPEYKVFIDPRQSPYEDQVYPDYQAIGSMKYPLNNQGLEAFMARYPARIALVHHENSYLMDWLRRSPDWSLTYFNSNASVLLHREVGTRLRPEALAVPLGPERFKNLSNPRVLRLLFAYYYILNPRLAEPIRDYYEQNVPNLYWDKKHTLQEMNHWLGGR